MNTNTTKQTVTVTKIGSTQYILLDDNQVARILTPVTKQNQVYFNLRMNDKTNLLNIKKINEMVNTQVDATDQNNG